MVAGGSRSAGQDFSASTGPAASGSHFRSMTRGHHRLSGGVGRKSAFSGGVLDMARVRSHSWLPMVGGARWILIGTAVMLVAGALSWSCGGGSSTNCVTTSAGLPVGSCGTPAPPGASLSSISICPGPPPSPTPVPSGSVSPSPTPTETACPRPLPTTVLPLGDSVQFHAVGTFSDNSTQDITDNSSTNWTTNDPTVVVANSDAGNFTAVGPGSAVINATSGGISGTSGAVIEVPPTPTPTPSPTPIP